VATILVVDDEPTARDLLVTILGYAGHRLLEASDGAEALERARGERPDLVIADLLMPTMSGFELVTLMRSDPVLARVPVVFYTANFLESEARSLARSCGVAHIIMKPAEPHTVLRTVCDVLGLPAQAPPAPAPPGETAARPEPARVFADALARRAQVLGPRLEALIDLSLQLASERDPRRLLEASCGAARKILGARYAGVGVTDELGTAVRHFFTSGMDAKVATRIGTPPPGALVLQRIVEDGRAVRLSQLAGDPTRLGLPPEHPPVHSFLGVPISSLNRRYGWLYLADKVGASAFSEEEERLAGIVAAQVGRIYENGSLYLQIEHRSRELETEVAERRRAEEALARRERELRAVLDGALDAMLIADEEGRWLEANPAASALFGAPREGLLGRSSSDFPITGADVEGFRGAFRKEGRLGGEFRLARPDGTVRDVEYRATADILPGRHLAVLRDITERKHLEAQLRHSQKMEAIGRLAGGVAHDFNNMLNVITGYGELLMQRLLVDDPLRRYARQVLAAAERAASLTRQLLIFSRKQVVQPQVLDLNSAVRDTHDMLRRTIGENIELVTSLSPDLHAVKADPGQIGQVLMNLVVNARDAMPRGGKLTIETRNVVLDGTDARQRPDARPGPHALLAVTDTGYGMPPEVLAHVFEPFFTTKEVGKGTGLGLATVYGIVKQGGGHVTVHSEEGRGTTVKVYLPWAEGVAVASEQDAPGTPPRGTETILLAEDEVMLREMATEILEGHGYTVLAARDGHDAIRIARDHPGHIDLLVTDVIMPGGLDGPGLARQLVASRPRLKVLFMSGYAEQAIVSRHVLEQGMVLLPKPFTPDELARRARQVLDS